MVVQVDIILHTWTGSDHKSPPLRSVIIILNSLIVYCNAREPCAPAKCVAKTV